MLFGHPGYATLSRFADGELSAKRQRRVADHLADCARCRQEIAFIRRAGDLARSLDSPSAPPELLARVLERRADGDRVLLPHESAGRPSTPPRRWLPVAAAIVALLAAGLLFTTGVLEADRSTLHITPGTPHPGDTLRVVYGGGQAFAGESYLRLRARYSTFAGYQWEQVAGALERDDEGQFSATIPLPDSVAYATFAVETLDGSRLDSRNRQLWDLVVSAPDGRPSAAGLHQRFADLFERDHPRALATARRATELYPESAIGWADLWVISMISSPSDSLRRFHQATLQTLERAATERPPADPDALAHLAAYAAWLGDWDSAEHWIREAERRGSQDVALAQARTLALWSHHRPRPGPALATLDSLWIAAPGPVPAVASAAWYLALDAGDWDAARTWFPRLRLVRDVGAAYPLLTELAAAFPADSVLDWALDGGRDAVLGSGGERALFRTQGDHERTVRESRQNVLARLAEAALDAGREETARELARQALPLAWETGALAEAGAVLLATGDTAGATTAWARVAADPAGDPAPAVLRARPDWTDRVQSAREQLIRYVLQGGVLRFLPPGLAPTAPEPGRGVTALLSACTPGVIDALNRQAEAFPEVRFIAYAIPPVGLTPEQLDDCGLEVPVRDDPTGEVRRAFGIAGTINLFVTDQAGRIRFEYSDAEEIPRQLLALSHRTGAADAD